jgi:hypothetical protein
MAFQQQVFNPYNVSKMSPHYTQAIASGQAKTDPFTQAQVQYHTFMTAAGYKQAETPNDIPAGSQIWAQGRPENPGIRSATGMSNGRAGSQNYGYGGGPAATGERACALTKTRMVTPTTALAPSASGGAQSYVVLGAPSWAASAAPPLQALRAAAPSRAVSAAASVPKGTFLAAAGTWEDVIGRQHALRDVDLAARGRCRQVRSPLMTLDYPLSPLIKLYYP